MELIPFGLELRGFMKVLKKKIYFPIVSWSADKIAWNIFDNIDYKFDVSWPKIMGKCMIVQIPGRHYSDPAYMIYTPFADPESRLFTQYAIGTSEGRDDVLYWAPIEGSTKVCTLI